MQYQKLERKKQLIVIGGGASGMVASIEAARTGAHVTLLEKENRVGRKLLATGNGRCNFANTQATPRDYHGDNAELIQSVLKAVHVDEVLSFFELLGITPKVEQDGKVYPYSDQGSNVLDVLRYEMEQLGIRVLTDHRVNAVQKTEKRFVVKTDNGGLFNADSVILATGGKAGSQFGADDSGYLLAQELGHTLITPFPALVQMKLNAGWLKTLKGVKWQGAASVISGGVCIRREPGELLFTDYGISGPPILQLTRSVNETGHRQLELWIHLLPDWTADEILDNLMMRFHVNPEKPAETCLLGLFHKRMIPVILREAGFQELQLPARLVTAPVIKSLASVCENWRIPINGTLSWKQAQVTAGGINAYEINPDSMESALVKGLYLTGEIMDVDGDCGGFNLYWAWATGMIAGRHAAVTGRELPDA